jgi:hypothetical protein
MDSFASGGVGASIVVVIGLIYSAVNHKRIRSTCCGRQVDASLDIENTTPTKIKIREPTTPKVKEETKSPA